MPSLKLLALNVLATTSGVFSSPVASLPQGPVPRGASLGPGPGTHNGFYYNYWTDGQGSVSYVNKDQGSYAVSWEKCGNFYAGKGWGPSDSRVDRKISYSAKKFNTTGNAYLSVYGMTRASPANKGGGLVEFYIMENYGTYDPSTAFVPAQSGRNGGVVKVDGGEYTLGLTRQVYWQPLPGTNSSVVLRLWSVRKSEQRRSSGTVDLKKHFDAWKAKLDIDIGTSFDFQIVAVEGYQSSGEAEVSVAEV
ncbi:glycoside hydrolase [Naviculisporaceae sp. PSN 640]